MTDRPFVLKLFSGPQVGGEVTLAPGRYVLGQGYGCQLIIDDVLVAAKHLAIQISEDAILVELLDGQATVDGLPFVGGSISPYQYLTIGGTHLAIGRRGEAWPLRPLPALNLIPREAPVAMESTAQDKPIGVPSVRRRQFAIPVVLTFILLLISGFLVWMLQSRRAVADATPKVPLEQRLWEVVKSAGAESQVQVEQSPRGWLVRGYLVRRDDRKKLQEDLRSLLPSASILLWDSESLATAVDGVLSAMNMPLDAEPGAAGEVIVSGSTSDSVAWQTVRSRIRRDVPYIRLLTEDVQIRPRQTPQLVSTATPEEDFPQLSQQDSSTAAPPSERFNDAPLPIAKPVLDIGSVAVGQHRVLVLADGTRVGLGGRVDGWMVMEIEVERVVLKQGENLYSIDLATP